MQLQATRLVLPVLALAFLAAGCGDADRQAAPENTPAATRASVQPLSAERIAQLRELYPRLGRKPLPEPKPSPDALPGEVPGAVASAASEKVLETATGEASFYADRFEGRRTASGIPFRQNQMVAAHLSYPFGTVLRVTNTRNNRSVNVRVVDRGPYGKKSRILDLSRRAARELDYIGSGAPGCGWKCSSGATASPEASLDGACRRCR